MTTMTTTDEPPQVATVARQLGIPTVTILNLIDQGAVPGYRRADGLIGAHIDDVRTYLDEHGTDEPDTDEPDPDPADATWTSATISNIKGSTLGPG